MYREFSTVAKTIDNIKAHYSKDSHIVLIRSTDDTTEYSSYLSCNKVIHLPDFSKLVKQYEIPSHAITRNYSAGFSYLYDTNIPFDYIVALCGDTYVKDPSNFDRRFEDMKNRNKYICLSQALGQNFHSSNSNPDEGSEGGRFQHESITDFMPQFFMVDGRKAIETKVFSNMIITNKYTSEQCLGDELIDKFKTFDYAIRLAKNAYDYSDGIIYQHKENR